MRYKRTILRIIPIAVLGVMFYFFGPQKDVTDHPPITYVMEQAGRRFKRRDECTRKNAEAYYRQMMLDEKSWNTRDYHMVEAIHELRKYYGDETKIIVWEHKHTYW